MRVLHKSNTLRAMLVVSTGKSFKSFNLWPIWKQQYAYYGFAAEQQLLSRAQSNCALKKKITLVETQIIFNVPHAMCPNNIVVSSLLWAAQIVKSLWILDFGKTTYFTIF